MTTQNLEPTRESIRQPREVLLLPDVDMLNKHPKATLAVAEGIADVERIASRGAKFRDEMLEVDREGYLTRVLDEYTLPNGQASIEGLEEFFLPAANPDKPVFVVTERDLTAKGANFVFGVTFEEAGISIQSIHRYLGLGEADIAKTVRHIARHEYAHLLGLTSRTVRNQDQRGGMYEGHCANPCTMQQVMSVTESLKLAKDREHEPNAGFCSDCVAFLSRQ